MSRNKQNNNNGNKGNGTPNAASGSSNGKAAPAAPVIEYVSDEVCGGFLTFVAYVQEIKSSAGAIEVPMIDEWLTKVNGLVELGKPAPTMTVEEAEAEALAIMEKATELIGDKWEAAVKPEVAARYSFLMSFDPSAAAESTTRLTVANAATMDKLCTEMIFVLRAGFESFYDDGESTIFRWTGTYPAVDEVNMDVLAEVAEGVEA